MFKLPKLRYELDALAPLISPFQLYIHYYRHHKGYVDNLNKLLEEKRQNSQESSLIYENKSVVEIALLSQIRDKKIFNNACQHFNHSFLWMSMTPTPMQVPPDILGKIVVDFGSFDKFKEKFMDVSNSLFGSGYTWVVLNPASRKIEIISTKDGVIPQVLGYYPLLNMDLWEHAYYLDYVNDRKKFIEKYFDYINWHFLKDNYDYFFVRLTHFQNSKQK